MLLRFRRSTPFMLIVFVLAFLISHTPAALSSSSSTILINEFMPKPSSGGEWVELFNPNPFDVDLSGWKIDDDTIGGSQTTIGAGTSIPANALVIVQLAANILNDTGSDAAQLLDAGTSIGANTEEARGAYSRREFASKNSIVLRECRETRFWLRVILATALASSETVTPLLAEADELVGIFTATVRRSRLPLTASKVLVFLVVILLVCFAVNF